MMRKRRADRIPRGEDAASPEDKHADYTIRPASPEDTETMARIAVRAWQPVYNSFRDLMGDELFGVAHADWRADKAGQIRSAAAPGSTVSFLVAEDEEGVLGFVSWMTRCTAAGAVIAEIGNNAVDPDAQNRGIASALYGEVIKRCREAGAAAVKVTTGLDQSHAPARRAYEKAGFDHGIPMVTYWQDLTDRSAR